MYYNCCSIFISLYSVSGTESRNSWLPEARRLGRGNPKLVARHSLSASTQAQALTALSLSGLKGGTGATNTKGDHVESTTEKKLPPQVNTRERGYTYTAVSTVDMYIEIAYSMIKSILHSIL